MQDDSTAQAEATREATPTPADINKMVQDRQTQQGEGQTNSGDGPEAPPENTDALKARIDSLESELAATKHHMLRNDIALKFGIDDDTRDILLSGTDEPSLVAQARALTERNTNHKIYGNIAPREGSTREAPSESSRRRESMVEFVEDMFTQADTGWGMS